jgi:peptide/nickel transport system permease protein
MGNIIGLFVGWNREGSLSKSITYTSMFLMQIPYYILAIILVFFFAYVFTIFPKTGVTNPLVHYTSINLRYIADVLWHSILPALSIIIASFGGWMVGMRQLIISILGEDYLLYAEASGLKKKTIMMKYAFKNAMLPQATGLAMRIGNIMSGTMLTETIFAYPGLGYLLFKATTDLDYNLMGGIFLFVIIGVLTANLLMDLIYPLLDPRITLGRKEQE